MIILRYIGYAAFLLAMLMLAVALNLGDIFLLAPSIALALSGVVFIAFDKVITTLCEIRDLLKPIEAINENELLIEEPTKTIAELEASISTARNKIKV